MTRKVSDKVWEKMLDIEDAMIANGYENSVIESHLVEYAEAIREDAFAPFGDRRQSLIEPRGEYEALVIEFTTFEAARKAQERMWSVTPPETITSSAPQVSDVMLSHARWFVGQALETMMNNVDGEPRSSMYVYDLLKKAEAALDIPDIGYSNGD